MGEPYVPVISDDEMRAALDEADNGGCVIEVVAPGWNYDGVVEIRLGNGWSLAVYNDCDEWDYLEWVQAPDGRRASFVTPGSMPGEERFTDSDVLQNWAPKHPERWGEGCPEADNG